MNSPAHRLPPPRLLFDAAIPSRSHADAFAGMSRWGPYANSEVDLGEGSLLFVFPTSQRVAARGLAKAVIDGVGTYKGFQKMFDTPVEKRTAIDHVEVGVALDDPGAPAAYRTAIEGWAATTGSHVPRLAVVVVPRSDRWETRSVYYESKAAFADLGIASQMVTAELLADGDRSKWAAADIALASFAKLGGVPWLVESPDDESLVLGVGRSEIRRAGTVERVFGYAVAIVSNGLYRQTWSVVPQSDESVYGDRLRDVIVKALTSDPDAAPSRLVVHLAKRAGRTELRAVAQAATLAGVNVPSALLRLDDTSLWDLADAGQGTYSPVKGTVVPLGPTRALLQSEGLTRTGPANGPILVELDRRSTVDSDEMGGLVDQAYRLAHANWRGFHSRSVPATLAYGEQLADLVGHMTDVEKWNPDRIPPDLARRPWFL